MSVETYPVDRIVSAVALVFGWSRLELRGVLDRKPVPRSLIEGRHVLRWALYHYGPELTLRKVGELCGASDHSTVSHSISRVNKGDRLIAYADRVVECLRRGVEMEDYARVGRALDELARRDDRVMDVLAQVLDYLDEIEPDEAA